MFQTLKNKKFQKISLVIGITTLTILSGILNIGFEKTTEAQSTEKELSGYAWSSNIGWISMNCSNTGSCSTSNYKVILDEANGSLTGEGWSSNIGWLQFGGLSGFPTGSSTQQVNARINSENGMEGWARFLGYGDDVVVENELAWDGWVSLSGEASDTTPYGPTRNGDTLSGYAWGDDVVGWVDFSGVSTTEPPAQCGNAHNLTTNTKPSTNLCDVGTAGIVSQSDQDSWTWSCSSDGSSAQCSADVPNGKWICNDEAIDIDESCGTNNICSAGYLYDEPTDSCLISTGIGEGEVTAFIAQPRLINSGDECRLEWTVNTNTPDSVLCEINSEDGDREIIDPSLGTSGTAVFGDANGITSTTNYIMSCYSATIDATTGIKTKSNMTPLSEKSARCIINPNFQEF